VIFTHQNLVSNWLTYLVHAKSTGELISVIFSDRSVRSLVSAKRSANRWDQTKKRLYFLADLSSQSKFKTQRNAERKTDPKSEMTHCISGHTVKFQYGGRLGEFNGMSSQSHVSHCRVLPALAEFTVTIPLQGAVTCRNQRHDRANTTVTTTAYCQCCFKETAWYLC